MERILADTNVLLRIAEPSQADHLIAVNALVSLAAKYGKTCVLAQNLIEFWNVATRPSDNNGFGWTSATTFAEVTRLESIFTVLPDTPDIYLRWKSVVVTNSVLGKNVHDARIAAATDVHQISKLLTFNGKDFKRFGNVEVIDPHSIDMLDEQSTSEY
ncbi:MAG: PIN domain-containing protein [Pyrinomonadaceae bacterium]